MARLGDAIRTRGEYRSEGAGEPEGGRAWAVLTMMHFNSPFLCFPCPLPSPKLALCCQAKERPMSLWGPVCHPALGPARHPPVPGRASPREPRAAGAPRAKLRAGTRADTALCSRDARNTLGEAWRMKQKCRGSKSDLLFIIFNKRI